MSRYFAVLTRAVGAFGKDQCTSFAAAISYYALFSLFPLVVFIISFLGFFIHNSTQRQEAVNTMFQLLGQGVDKNALYTQVNSFAGGRGGLGLIGLVLALWSASAVFGAVRTGLNVAWDVTKARPLVRGKLLDLGMVLGVGLLMLLSIAATGVLAAVQSFSTALLGRQMGGLTHLAFALLTLILPAAISFLAFVLVYYVVPHAEIRLKDVWFGALVAALLFQIAQIGFGFYAADFAHYDTVYGSLGTVIAFLFFVYIAACILLFGGEVTKEYIDIKSGVKPAQQPETTTSQEPLERRAIGMVKGLFVDESPHHDTSLPYEPGKERPSDGNGTLVKDDQAQPETSTSNGSRRENR